MIIHKGWITYQLPYALRHNDAKNIYTDRPALTCLRHFQNFDNIDSFPKNFECIWGEKANYIFEGLAALYLIILLISFFPSFCGLQQKIEPSWRNYLFQIQSQAEHNTTSKQIPPDYSSVNARMLVIFWTERDFCIISDCMNSFNNKLKNLWTSKKNFNPANNTVFIWRIP